MEHEGVGGSGDEIAYPDTLVGTDSRTTMVNGLGVLGSVGGIEAEAAMLGQPVSMIIPEVVGFHLTGASRKGSPPPICPHRHPDAARQGVVGRFVEFFGPGVSGFGRRSRHHRQYGAEYGATCGFFPIDHKTLGIYAPDRPARGDDRARRSLCQGAGHG